MVWLEVYNEGKKMEDSQINRAFERYYTTKPSDEGSGLVLYISKIIVEQRMGGSIGLTNRSKGVSCIIKIPSEETAYE